MINEQGVTVTICKKVEYTRRNCMKTRKEVEDAIKDTIRKYKEITFGSDTPSCMACLDELRKQQVFDQKIYDGRWKTRSENSHGEELQRNIVMDGDTMIDKRTGEVLDPEVDFTYWKDKF